MRPKVAIVYNEPRPDRYGDMGEELAVLGVLQAVEAVDSALKESGFVTSRVPLRPPIEKVKSELEKISCDLFFNLFEGFEGKPETEASVAKTLDETGIPYTGCPTSALDLALDKTRVKAILEYSGIYTPGYQILTPDDVNGFYLKFPCIVKPCKEDASHGLSEESVVKDFVSLRAQVSKVSSLFGGKALVEEFIGGKEFNTTVIGNGEIKALSISEIEYTLPVSKPRLLTFEAKWKPESIYFQGTKPVCPAKIQPELEKQIVQTALAVFRIIVLRGYARVDMRLDNEGKIRVLEVNPNPDISPSAGAAIQAMASGMSYRQFIDIIVELVLKRA